MKIAVLDDYQNVVKSLPNFSKVADHEVTIWNDSVKDPAALADRLREVEALALIRERTPITDALLERLPKLRLISQVGVYPHIDVEACTRHGVLIASRTMPGGTSWSTAELNWGLIIAAMRRIPQENAAMRAGQWQTQPPGYTLRGKTLGIYGYGKLGSATAGYGKAFGMKVIVWGRETTLAKARADGFALASSRQALFAESDVLSLHLRLIPETRGIVTPSDLAAMKPTALLVNTSRAGLIVPGALAAALQAGRPGMAALDVFDEEPALGARDPLISMPNVVCVPHLGYVEHDALNVMFGTLFDQILAYGNGAPINIVNPEAAAQRRA